LSAAVDAAAAQLRKQRGRLLKNVDSALLNGQGNARRVLLLPLVGMVRSSISGTSSQQSYKYCAAGSNVIRSVVPPNSADEVQLEQAVSLTAMAFSLKVAMCLRNLFQRTLCSSRWFNDAAHQRCLPLCILAWHADVCMFAV
jgi:hypothetical protein